MRPPASAAGIGVGIIGSCKQKLIYNRLPAFGLMPHTQIHISAIAVAAAGTGEMNGGKVRAPGSLSPTF